jgi:hypothetical protein
VLALALSACSVETPAQTDDDPEVARVEAELANYPGTLVVTHSSDMPFSDALVTQLETADKIIHVYSDGRVAAYLGAPADHLPADVPAFRLFRELHGDITIGNQDLLADYIRQQEPRKDGVAEAIGLPIGDGALWPDSTVAYVIDGSITAASEVAAVKQAITTWNRAVDPLGTPMKVRFVPRYPGDGRPYVSFVRGGSGGCGSSQVGRHDNIFTNWWSHNIRLDCFDQGTILHEMGHTAGLFHEQQRCDRDSYVNVMAPSGIDCERYCGGNHVDYGPYNYLSVMHYPYNNVCSIQQITPTASNFRGNPWDVFTRGTLDTFDVQAINTMYRDRASLPAIGSSRFYALRPQYTSKVIIVPGGSTANDTQLLLWDRYPGYFDQEFSVVDVGEGYVELHPRHAPWKCMEVYGFSTANGGAVKQWDCWGGVNQQWIIAPSAGAPGFFDLINKNSLKSLDVTGWGTANGTPIQQWDHLSGTNQQFALTPGV